MQDGPPMQRRQFVQEVQQALQKTGAVGEHFNGHSFYIGAITSASQAGVPETVIKILGRWSSMSYQRYIRHTIYQRAGSSSKDNAGPQFKVSSHHPSSNATWIDPRTTVLQGGVSGNSLPYSSPAVSTLHAAVTYLFCTL